MGGKTTTPQCNKYTFTQGQNIVTSLQTHTISHSVRVTKESHCGQKGPDEVRALAGDPREGNIGKWGIGA